MEAQLISFGTAALAQKKGFDWECVHKYSNQPKGEKPDKWTIISKPTRYGVNWNNQQYYGFNDALGFNSVSAPTQTLLQKWLRDIHGIYVHERPVYMKDSIHFEIFILYNDNHVKNLGYAERHEIGIEDGLQEALKLIET